MKSMKDQERCSFKFSEAFYASATIGERGQIVIPAEARAELGFSPGDKVMVMRHPMHKGIMMFKLEAMREFMDDFAADLARLEEKNK